VKGTVPTIETFPAIELQDILFILVMHVAVAVPPTSVAVKVTEYAVKVPTPRQSPPPEIEEHGIVVE
jgi:hypothetical protein